MNYALGTFQGGPDPNRSRDEIVQALMARMYAGDPSATAELMNRGLLVSGEDRGSYDPDNSVATSTMTSSDQPSSGIPGASGILSTGGGFTGNSQALGMPGQGYSGPNFGTPSTHGVLPEPGDRAFVSDAFAGSMFGNTGSRGNIFEPSSNFAGRFAPAVASFNDRWGNFPSTVLPEVPPDQPPSTPHITVNKPSAPLPSTPMPGRGSPGESGVSTGATPGGGGFGGGIDMSATGGYEGSASVGNTTGAAGFTSPGGGSGFGNVGGSQGSYGSYAGSETTPGSYGGMGAPGGFSMTGGYDPGSFSAGFEAGAAAAGMGTGGGAEGAGAGAGAGAGSSGGSDPGGSPGGVG